MIRLSVAWDDIGGLVDAHERFLSGAPVEADVRGPVLESWKRCRSAGLQPHRLHIPRAPDPALDDRFLRAADPVLRELAASLTDVGMAIALCDAYGRMVRRLGGDLRLRDRLDQVRFAPGFDASEAVAGTNGIGTALAERSPVYVVGREHFADCLQPFACAGAPVRDPLSGRIEAAVDLTCLRDQGDPVMQRLVHAAAQHIESRLLEQATQRERALLAAYRRAGAQAGEWPGQPEVPGGEGRLSRLDLAVLRERAEELIASPHRTLDEVTLPDGRVAALLRRPVQGLSGETGVAVEARVLGSPSPITLDVTPPPPVVGPTPEPARTPVVVRAVVPPLPAGPPQPSGPSGPSEPPGNLADGVGAGDDGRRLVLVGEPGVGRLAVLARRRLELLHEAGGRIGTTLDVTRTAEELTEVAVPRFADLATVDLPDAVLRGEEPGPLGAGTRLRRVAVTAGGETPHPYGVGEQVVYEAAAPQARSLESTQAVLEPEPGDRTGRQPLPPVSVPGLHSLITVPLSARGAILGVVSFYRCAQPAPFEDDDLSLAQELAGRAAICVDNARRYTREHHTALALQRSLLPKGRPEQSAVEAAYRYLPARAGVGGDWFDVIPLSGARVALVVGDVVGHGLHAAATMGRLRTAVHNFCSLDLPPEELLTHLDDLVARLDRCEGWAVGGAQADSGIVGATCLYAVYDPVSRRCCLTRAGHLPPAVVGPDGAVEFLDLPSGPPLGLGGMPFEMVELELAEGSQLVLYTDGLVEDRVHDIDVVLQRLHEVLAVPGRAPEDTCEAVLDALLPVRPSDDVALLVARTRALGPEQVAQWELPCDPAVVSRSRAAVIGQLTVWGLDDLAFTTELVVSELVTNAIRHATGPVQLRLLRDRALICEVADGSSTAPRLRRARTEDEGGRGLFLVARLTERWGTRYTADGKVIWTEQRLP
ncbi:SpoIIE family protein phosphatase [Streptomyces sp. NPDC020490]|uniref:SpoIIE family protein phosphatase n=1 Tax=Streptomyces sp. NPDC020490 TaxID=3365078 RepID=UPI00378A5D8A